MKSLFYIIFLNAVLSLNLDFNMYHKTNDIEKQLDELQSKCNGLFTIYENQNDSKLKYYDITSKEESHAKKNNIFILAGEHPRELISVELMFHFVKLLCKEKNQILLKENNYRIIVNANPHGRIHVEEGKFCTRTNDKEVDINRNWDIYWHKKIFSKQENPGTKPFSEIETIFIRDSVKSFNPKLFLTIHSGVYGLYYPYAYLEEEGNYNIENMRTISEKIKNEYCSVCKAGPPSKLIGYKSSGTCLDYIYDKYQVPYALAWEIYSNEVIFPEMEFMKNSFKDINKQLDKFLDDNEENSNNNDNDFCLKLFNPIDRTSFDFIISNWTMALIELINYVKSN